MTIYHYKPKPTRLRPDVFAVYQPAFATRYYRPLISTHVPAGFPSPAEDYIEGRLDLTRHLVKHQVATYYIRVSGDSMIGANIHPGNLLVVDRSEETCDGHVVVARINDELCVKRLSLEGGTVRLISENPNYDPIVITEEMDFEVWGRVMHCIQSF